MMCCGQETTTVPMRRNEGACCHAQKLPSLDLRRTMPGKDSNEERIFKGLGCATPDPHLRSDYTLTGMRAKCCTSDWKWGDYLRRDCNHPPRITLNSNGSVERGSPPAALLELLTGPVRTRRVSVYLPTLVRELSQSGLMPEIAGSYAKR